MEHHPEQQAGEIYMGNTLPSELSQSSWRTRRLGTSAFFANGTPMTKTTLRPWFIKESEVEADVAKEASRAAPDHDRIKALTQMVQRGHI